MPDHNDPEAEYFARLELEKKAKLAEQVAEEQAVAERAHLKQLHAGHCGRCGGTFVPTGFRGVEIDVCADCGSVLLDPGELEQLSGQDETGVIASIATLFNFGRTKGS